MFGDHFVDDSVVTGSTDGIGKEYAKQLAQRGINIVLIARNEAKLIATSREIGMELISKCSASANQSNSIDEFLWVCL